MPDGVLFLKGMAAAAGASAIFVLALGCIRRPASTTRFNIAAIVAVALGLVAGCFVLEIRPGWPPGNALVRLLTIVIPAIVGIELLGCFSAVPRWLVWGLRLSLAMSIGRILVHNSVYTTSAEGAWAAFQPWIWLGCCATLLVTVWYLLLRLADRSPGASLPLAIAETCVCSGVAIMLAGYLTGGKAALALAAAVTGAAAGAGLAATRPPLKGAIGIGVVGLSGLLFVGRFFGGVSTGRALVLLFSPLLCWMSELPILRCRSPWLIGIIRLAFVAVPLFVVIFLEKRDFDRHTAPLIGATNGARSEFSRSIDTRLSKPPGLSGLSRR
jgi:hypothetical protein